MRTAQAELVRMALGCPCRDGDVHVLRPKQLPTPPVPDPPPEPEAA